MRRIRRRPIWSAAALALGVLMAVGLAQLLTAPAGAQAGSQQAPPLLITPASPTHRVTLRDRLISGLQARRKSEIDFVDEVAEAVREGKIPQRLVDQTFFWARQRASHPRFGQPHRPIVFFQPAMTIRAKKLGLEL